MHKSYCSCLQLVCQLSAEEKALAPRQVSSDTYRLCDYLLHAMSIIWLAVVAESMLTARLCRTLLQANNRRPTTVPTSPKGTLATLGRGSLTARSSNAATKHRRAVQHRSPRRIQTDLVSVWLRKNKSLFHSDTTGWGCQQCTQTREIHTQLSPGMEEGLRSAIPIRHPAFSARPALKAKKVPCEYCRTVSHLVL